MQNPKQTGSKLLPTQPIRVKSYPNVAGIATENANKEAQIVSLYQEQENL